MSPTLIHLTTATIVVPFTTYWAYRQLPPGETPAISIPFAVLPPDIYIRGMRYRVSFDRIVLPRIVTP